MHALRSYGVLDAAHDEALDAIVRVASVVCNAPIALVSLTDVARQWFAATRGVGDMKETPREMAFCAEAILGPEILVVEDARRDERFEHSPLVVGAPNIRFYAGCPLVDSGGFALGSLCVLDTTPRGLDASQAAVLRELATAVVRLLEARRADNELVVALEAIRRRGELLTLAEELAGIGHLRFEVGTGRFYWSPQQYRIYGRDPAHFVPSVAASIEACHADDRARLAEMLNAAVERQESVTFQTRIVRPDGAVRLVQRSLRPEVDATTGVTLAVVGVTQDVTDAHALRARISRQERLVTAGTLAAGVGHEINNPLTYVGANVELAIEEVSAVAEGAPPTRLREVVEILEDAREGTNRIRKIVRGLRAFAREDVPLGAVDVWSTLEMSIDLASHELRKSAHVSAERAEVSLVLADEGRLAQVFVNLLVNAAQAFPTADPENNRIVVRAGMLPDGRVWVEVEDNGPGIAPDVLSRIYDPFFTTKSVGQGTGLGLAISHNIIVSLLGGELTCQTERGKGTTFRVVLPPATPEVPAGSGSTPGASVMTRGRVLAIDDEEAVLRVIGRVLHRDNDVVAVDDAREALRVILKSGASFDAIFCDLMMPHMTGMELYESVRRHDAALADRFVFLTGGTVHESVRNFLETVPNPRLEKPFVADDLRAVARRMTTSAREIQGLEQLVADDAVPA